MLDIFRRKGVLIGLGVVVLWFLFGSKKRRAKRRGTWQRVRNFGGRMRARGRSWRSRYRSWRGRRRLRKYVRGGWRGSRFSPRRFRRWF